MSEEKKKNALVVALDERDDELKALLQHNKSVFRKAVEVYVATNKSIMSCEPLSVLKAVMACATAGLIPDGREAAIVPFKSKATLMPMYPGLLKLANANGRIKSVRAECVYSNDHFEVALGDKDEIIHTRPALGQDRGEMIGAYSIIETVNGGSYKAIMDMKEITAVENVSRNSKDSPWHGPFRNRMVEKTVLRRALSRFPGIDQRLATAIAADNDGYDFANGKTNGTTIDQTPTARPITAEVIEQAPEETPAAPVAAAPPAHDAPKAPTVDEEKVAILMKAYDASGSSESPATLLTLFYEHQGFDTETAPTEWRSLPRAHYKKCLNFLQNPPSLYDELPL